MDTKTKLLDSAEQLFGEKGYDATSLRDIIAHAGVNLAAIHYHFGSKQDLLDELILRRAAPVNAQRMARLDELEAAAGTGPLVIETVLEAFMIPMSEAADRNPQFVRLMGRIHAEGMMLGVVKRHFQDVLTRFLGALARALPELPQEELLWRIHFMTGAMAHTMCGSPDYTRVSSEPSPFRVRIPRLIAFLSGARKPPLPQIETAEEPALEVSR